MNDFPKITIGSSNDVFPWKYFENTHLALTRGISCVVSHTLGLHVFGITGCGAVGSAHRWGW